jgi:hypothetical protein
MHPEVTPSSNNWKLPVEHTNCCVNAKKLACFLPETQAQTLFFVKNYEKIKNISLEEITAV